jgi:hypothetical protein
MEDTQVIDVNTGSIMEDTQGIDVNTGSIMEDAQGIDVNTGSIMEDAQGIDVNTDDILVVRKGPGANCSSIGSALDVLFLSAVAAGVILASVAAALGEHARAPKPPGAQGPRDGEASKEEGPDARTT